MTAQIIILCMATEIYHDYVQSRRNAMNCSTWMLCDTKFLMMYCYFLAFHTAMFYIIPYQDDMPCIINQCDC